MVSIKQGLAAAIVGLMTLTGAASAQAAQEFYPPDLATRTFDQGSAGWLGTGSSEGLCVPVLLCPSITNSYQSNGGVEDSGFIRTAFGSLTGVAATSSGSWISPSFTYQGVGGEAADDLTLKIARRSDVAALLSVTGNSATYSVEIFNTSGGNGISVISRETLAGLTDFADESVTLDPSDLRIGRSYQIRITSRLESGVQVLPGGSADYDNVRIRAKRAAGSGSGGGSGGGGGGGGPSGGGGGNGGDGALPGGGRVKIGKRATLDGAELLIKVKCARKPRIRCKAKVDARLLRRGPKVTNNRVVRVLPGRTRRIELDLKPKYQDEVRALESVVVQQRSKLIGEKRAKKGYKRVKVKILD